MHARKRVKSQEELLKLSERLLSQKKHDKHKLYSCLAPEVECISKGKAHKKHEFGCKVSVAATSRDNWIVGIKAHHGNLMTAIHLPMFNTDTMNFWKSGNDTNCYHCYRGHTCTGDTQILITRDKRGLPITRSLRKWLWRLCTVEPVIGHMKSDTRMDRNYLKGKERDTINAILCGCGANIGKLIKAFFLSFVVFTKIREKMLQYIKITGMMKILSCQNML